MPRMGVFGFLGRRRLERAGYELYGAAVATARDPYFYRELSVPDTLDGRFDLVGLHAFLVIRQLRGLAEPGPRLAQGVFDAMFSDMDINLREMGVSDLSVGKRVRAMWEAFHGRASAYQAALAAGDRAALAEALSRNVWRDSGPAAGAEALARITERQDAHLAGQAPGLLAGRVSFLKPAEAAP